ncbi:hypothetical protein ARMGADRAFT_1077480 [Armillaria gallica]|uniref:Uncharacterized protein n=1 Tax=Armillaria gallica TaxID=47427 RepID=A0A2H3DL59_ARMGA|nr:hypothetical protein ARMGADRAFT_1077480 [Armillaria gallica]
MASDNTSGDDANPLHPSCWPFLEDSQSSRNAYEEEIERLQQQIRYMEEEIDLMHSGSPPPSYRSSPRSDISDPFELSSSPPPPSPSREIAR